MTCLPRNTYDVNVNCEEIEYFFIIRKEIDFSTKCINRQGIFNFYDLA